MTLLQQYHRGIIDERYYEFATLCESCGIEEYGSCYDLYCATINGENVADKYDNMMKYIKEAYGV